jgi:hypothetical protein
MSGYPRSNVRIGHVLTAESFYGCAPCADGEHGSIEDGRCACCGWDPAYKAGSFIAKFGGEEKP